MESATDIHTGAMPAISISKSGGDDLEMDDKSIYDELIAPMESAMMRSIWRVLRKADLAEDCLQEALTVIWVKRLQLVRHPNPNAFILKICLNSAYDSLRKFERQRRQIGLSQLENTQAPACRDANQYLAGKDCERRVQQAIRRLPRKRALAVMMHLLQDESYAEIAQALDCSEVTVRIHVSRGLAQLRQWLSPFRECRRREGSHV